MDRDDLLGLLGCMEDDTLVVRQDGTLVTESGNDWSPEDVEAAITELTAELETLLKWCKAAPKYSPAEVTK